MHVNVPGKVFILGEYTVIDRQTDAIIAPTKARLDVHITPSDTFIYESPFDGVFEGKSLTDLNDQHPSPIWASLMPYIKALDSDNLLDKPFKVRIESQLDHGKIPFGLGSSGAYRVGLIKAFMAYLQRPLDALEIFHIASLSSENETSSYGDLAVSSFERAIHYQKPETLNPLSKMIIDPVKLPPFLILHSGKKVSSKPFIETYMQKRHEPFVETYRTTIQEAITHFKGADVKAQLTLIKRAHRAYLTFAEALDPGIIPEAFIPIFVAIEETGGIPKVSGAGGGDNILAFYPDEKTLKNAYAVLTQSYSIFEPAR